jgi:hypothetical protein
VIFFLSAEKPKWYLSLFNVFAGLVAGLFVLSPDTIALVLVFPFAWAAASCAFNHWIGDLRLHRMAFELAAARAGKRRILGLPPLWAFYLSELVEALALSLSAGVLVVGVKMWIGLL